MNPAVGGNTSIAGNAFVATSVKTRGSITMLELGIAVGGITSVGNTLGVTSTVVLGDAIVLEPETDGKGLTLSSSIRASS